MGVAADGAGAWVPWCVKDVHQRGWSAHAWHGRTAANFGEGSRSVTVGGCRRERCLSSSVASGGCVHPNTAPQRVTQEKRQYSGKFRAHVTVTVYAFLWRVLACRVHHTAGWVRGLGHA